MNGDKQIEEMAKYIAEVSHFECTLKPCDDCRWCCTERAVEANCTDYLIAEHIYNADYRKASEVAREIFEEIETRLCGNILLAEDIAELKKKYTEGSK